METTVQTRIQEASNGVLDAFITVMIMLLCGLIALPINKFSSGQTSRTFIAGHLVSANDLYWIGVALWGVELGLYGLICWFLSQRNVKATLKGIALGLILRVLVCLLMASLLSGRYSFLELLSFSDMSHGLWILRLLAIFASSIILLFPCRGLIESGFSSGPQKGGVRPGGRVSNFSFKAMPEQVPINITDRPIVQASGAQNHLAPADDFIPMPPREGITGVVNLPVSLVLESIPELEPYLDRNHHIRVRLAYVIPQLSRATVWLTWQQVFGEGINDLSLKQGFTQFPDSKFSGRWIRIPAKYYVPQMPGEFFEHALAPVTPNWMKLPPVPQEDQFRG